MAKSAEVVVVKYQYEGEKGRRLLVPKDEISSFPKEICAVIYNNECKDCKLKTGRINILGRHCTLNGDIVIKNGKCASKTK